MQTQVFSDIFPLLNTANPQTLEWLISVAVEHEYPGGRAVLMEDAWGNAVYFLVSGWVKVRRTNGDDSVTIAILGRGDFFGEMAVLDESPRSTDVIALSPVKLLTVSRERFIQILFKDPQLHHRMLQLMVRRLRQINIRLQMKSCPPAVKLAHTLVGLAENYGKSSPQGKEILYIPYQDLAQVTEITLDETTKIMDKLNEKQWIKIDSSKNTIHILNFPQMVHLANKF
ncbi:MAG: Crp/Fnr family transcriptional regulator [Nostocales cyanobacterium]|nr:MAG: Crp/Fnr family transcriptional regulator [Nostocales cyanobacterium]TAF12443.1 MAG: Crp/Fnr family transcriptional regulator [Nostocales cyanobacterium]